MVNLTPLSIVPLKPVLRAPRAEDWPAIFTGISENRPLKDLCEELGLHRPTVDTRISSDDELSRQWMLARAQRADRLAEKALETADGVLDGTIEPGRAKVALPIYQWAAAQLNPKSWGQSTIKTEVTGKDGAALAPGQNVVIFQLPDNGR